MKLRTAAIEIRPRSLLGVTPMFFGRLWNRCRGNWLLNPRPAAITKNRLWRANPRALRTVQVRRGMPPLNDEIANVRNPSKSVSEDEYRISLIKQGIAQQQQRPAQTQPPKCRRNHDAFELFGGIPLHKETGKEYEIA